VRCSRVAAGPWCRTQPRRSAGLCSLVSAARVRTRDCWGTPDVAGQSDCDFRSTLAGCWGNRALAATDVQASGVCWKAC
jgi:hypothetical protein